MEKIVIGNPVLIEVTVYKYPAFGVLALDDPEGGVKVTITDPSGTILLNSQTMIKNATGQYYYIFQTTASNILGIHQCNIFADGATYDSAYITNKLFELIKDND